MKTSYGSSSNPDLPMSPPNCFTAHSPCRLALVATEETAIYHRTRQPLSTRSTPFYFDDPLICIKVDTTLYKVHKDKLEGESLKLQAYMNQTQTWSSPPGLSDAHPLILNQCSCSEFEAFLFFIYERDNDIQRRSICFFIDLLSFATVYGCPRITEISSVCISARVIQLDAVQRLAIGKRYNLPLLQRSAYTYLSIRATFLSDREATHLDKRDLLLIGRAQLRTLRESELHTDQQTAQERSFWEYVGRVVEETFFAPQISTAEGGQMSMTSSWTFPEDEVEDSLLELGEYDKLAKPKAF